MLTIDPLLACHHLAAVLPTQHGHAHFHTKADAPLWAGAQPRALVETQSTEIVVVPHEGGSPTTGSTDLAYTLRLSPKDTSNTEVRTDPQLSLNLIPNHRQHQPDVHAAPVA